MENSKKSYPANNKDPNKFQQGPEILLDNARNTSAITAERDKDLGQLLEYINQNYVTSALRPTQSAKKGLTGKLALFVKRFLQPFARVGAGEVLSQQITFNAHQVRVINEMMAILEKQQRHNEELINLLHNIKIRLDMTRTDLDQLQEKDRKITKRFDEQFVDQNIGLVLYQKIEALEEKILRLEKRFEKSST